MNKKIKITLFVFVFLFFLITSLDAITNKHSLMLAQVKELNIAEPKTAIKTIHELKLLNKTKPETILDKICFKFGKYCEDALIIAMHENRKLDPYAISATGDYGIMQVNCYWETKRQIKYYKNYNFDCKSLLDVDTNLNITYANFKRDGYSWKSWSTCKYLPKCY